MKWTLKREPFLALMLAASLCVCLVLVRRFREGGACARRIRRFHIDHRALCICAGDPSAQAHCPLRGGAAVVPRRHRPNRLRTKPMNQRKHRNRSNRQNPCSRRSSRSTHPR